MGTTLFDHELFWINGQPERRIRRIGRRLLRNPNVFDKAAQRRLAAVRAALQRQGTSLEARQVMR